MSGKFGLMDDSDELDEGADGKIDLSGFAPVKKRSPIDVVEMDAAVAPHGFISRESTPVPVEFGRQRRRTASPRTATRYLAIRMDEPQYVRFLRYADRYELTYHEAIKKLLDAAGE